MVQTLEIIPLGSRRFAIIILKNILDKIMNNNFIKVFNIQINSQNFSFPTHFSFRQIT